MSILIIQDIYDMWEKDSQIDTLHLDQDSIGTAKLIHKYLTIYTDEKMIYHKIDQELKSIRLEKFEFYTQGPTQETKDKGWVFPAVGKILRQDVQMYMDADPDISRLNLRLSLQKEKMNYLETVIRTLQYRWSDIKNAIDWRRFQAGS